MEAPVRYLTAGSAHRVAVDLFVVAGTRSIDANLVASHLVGASLRGVHSHGIMRVPQYLAEIAAGGLDPAAAPSADSDGSALTKVDGNRAFGQVGGHFAVRVAVAAAAKHGIGMASLRNVAHTGRIGEYAEAIAAAGQVGLVMASGTGLEGRWVSPHGARDGRFSTDPIAFAAPAGQGVLCADFATSAAAEGVVRSLRNRGLRAPEWMLLDSAGVPTEDPAVLYGDPPGTIQPLGGAALGYKGTGLNLLVEIIATLVAGLDHDDEGSPHNTLAVVAIRGDARLPERMSRFLSFVRSARPVDPSRPLMLPGDPEREALAKGGSVLVDEPTVEALRDLTRRYGVAAPDLM